MVVLPLLPPIPVVVVPLLVVLEEEVVANCKVSELTRDTLLPVVLLLLANTAFGLRLKGDGRCSSATLHKHCSTVRSQDSQSGCVAKAEGSSGMDTGVTPSVRRMRMARRKFRKMEAIKRS